MNDAIATATAAVTARMTTKKPDATTTPIPTGGGPAERKFWRATMGVTRWWVVATDLGAALAILARLVPDIGERIEVTRWNATQARRVTRQRDGASLAELPMGAAFTEGE